MTTIQTRNPTVTVSIGARFGALAGQFLWAVRAIGGSASQPLVLSDRLQRDMFGEAVMTERPVHSDVAFEMLRRAF